jgi:mannose-6-phosphate isomerase
MGRLVRITNTPRDYAWGARGGIARLLGRPPVPGLEAELWLGAHPGSPSVPVGDDAPWADLHEWEERTGRRLPFLLKLLTAAEPLSIQAHPSPEQARSGFERENALGIPVDAPTRNYRDPYAKPELIVAVEDGFQALCGFREPADILRELDALADLGLGPDLVGLRSRLVGPDPLRRALVWLLGGDLGVGDLEVARLVGGLTGVVHSHPGRFPVLLRISMEYPGDPGLVVALMMNQVTLAAGEALWLPAGNIHAYLRGSGVELMGPSDNVLRGGLTPKHVDVAELERVLDFTPISSPLLLPEPAGANAVAYRPASRESGRDVPFQLLAVGGDLEQELDSPAIAVCLDGAFELATGGESLRVDRGDAAFIDAEGILTVHGAGRLFVAR